MGWKTEYGEGVALFSSTWQAISFGTGYYIFDGQVGQGTSGHGIHVRRTGAGRGQVLELDQDTGGHVVLRHLRVQGAGKGVGSSEDGINAGGRGMSNVTIQYCYVHDVGRCNLYSDSSHNWLVERNWFARNESTSDMHAEGWSAKGCNNMTVRYNVWEDIEGTAVIAFSGDNWGIHGNVCFYSSSYSGYGVGHGSFAGWNIGGTHPVGNVTNASIHHNTILDDYGGGGYTTDSHSIYWYNNIILGGYPGGFSMATHDYNLYDYNIGEENGQYWTGGYGLFADKAGYDWRLAQATNAGKTDLGAEFNTDPLGVTRGADGVWDRGAYEYSSGVTIHTPSVVDGISFPGRMYEITKERIRRVLILKH